MSNLGLVVKRTVIGHPEDTYCQLFLSQSYQICACTAVVNLKSP